MDIHLQYILLLFVLLILPLALQRYRIPSAISAFILGLIASLGFHWFAEDTTIRLLATFGIVSMFLFAGLEMDFNLLIGQSKTFLSHLILQFVLVLITAKLISGSFDLSSRPSIILAMALLTPSAGFILSSLPTSGMNNSEQIQVKGIVLTNELATLLLMFLVLQTTSLGRLAISASSLVALVVLLPVVFRLFARLIIPYAPKSEFAFLILVAVVSAVITRELGIYYLLGAFVVGITAQRFRASIPRMTSAKMLHAVEMFSTLFIPFYFFNAGGHVQAADVSWEGVLTGVSLIMIVLPLRWLVVTYHRHWFQNESFASSSRIGLNLLPTLVFTLVLAGILHESFHIPPALYGALIIYAMISTVLPQILRHWISAEPMTETITSMPKMSHSGEDHGDVQFVAGGDDFRVSGGASRLNDGPDTKPVNLVHTVTEGEESIRSADRPQ
jgi:Kef-type K+ transport system membrane component KefB